MKTLIFSILLLSSAVLNAQNAYTVDNIPGSGADFSSLQAAIDVAAVGDTLYIQPSPNTYGNIIINKTIHLRGMGHLPEYNSGELAIVDVITLNGVLGAPNSSIQGLRIKRIGVSGDQNYSGLSITNNFFTSYIHGGSSPNQSNNWYIAGNRFHYNGWELINTKESNNWMVINNFIHQTTTNDEGYNSFRNFKSTDVFRNNIIVSNQNGASVDIFQDCANLTVENCLFLFTGTAAGIGTPNSTVVFNNNLTYSYVGQTISALNGSDNLDNTDPQFVNATSPEFSYSKDFHLNAASPGVNAGTDGQQLGVHGNSFSFNMRGYPDDIPYPVSMTINNTNVENGGTLEVEFEAVGN